MGNALIVAIYHNHTGSRLRGYMPGDPLQLVHETCFGYIGPDWTGGPEPRLNIPVRRSLPVCPSILRQVASVVTRILNGSWSGTWEREILDRYRVKGLRPPETGDVFVIDPGGPRQWLLARHFSGWFTVTEPLIPLTPRELALAGGARS